MLIRLGYLSMLIDESHISVDRNESYTVLIEIRSYISVDKTWMSINVDR